MDKERRKMKEKKDRSSSSAALARGSQPNSPVRRAPGTAKISSRTSPAKPKSKTNTSSKSPEKGPPKSKPFMIVGIGASAGGLEAFTQLLRNLPADTGMAFVLVQHLDPKHESMLTRTSLPENEYPGQRGKGRDGGGTRPCLRHAAQHGYDHFRRGPGSEAPHRGARASYARRPFFPLPGGRSKGAMQSG